MLQTCCHNALPFRTLLNDVWFASAENMRWVKTTLGKEFVMPLKSNRKVAVAVRSYEPIGTLLSEKNPTALIFLEAVPFPLLLTRHVQTDKNGREHLLYLVSSDLNLSHEQVLALYQKRWKVEEYHKSLKQHAALATSPTRTVVTQTNHVFAAIYGFVKLEQLQIKTKLSHFALRARIDANALAAALRQVRALSRHCPA
jgi:hypothetical protein